MRVSRKCLERTLSLVHYCHPCLRSQKFPELPALTLNFAPRKKVKRERSNISKPLSSADWELRGPRAICIPVCGGLRDTDDKLGSQCCAPSCGRSDGSFPSLSSKEGPWQHPGHHHTILRGPGHHTRASLHPTVRGQKKPCLC